MIPDPDFEQLVATGSRLRSAYVLPVDQDPWRESPFAWILSRPSRQVGKIGEELVAGWCAAKRLHVSKPGDSECDLVVQGRRVEVKFSTLWESGQYTFQQFRDQRYEFAFLLGISPRTAHAWIVPKTTLKQYVIGHTPQHAGKKGGDTFWLSFAVSNPPQWLSAFGGDLATASRVLLATFPIG